jgi:outer membrane protein
MSRPQRFTASGLCLAGLLWAAGAASQPLTVDRAVAIALEKNSQMINALAGVLDANGNVYGAYSGVLPHVSASWSRSATQNVQGRGSQIISTVVITAPPTDNISYSMGPALTGTWSILDLANLKALGAARSGLKASKLSQLAARTAVAFDTRQQFFITASAYHLAWVSDVALRLARDNERRVRALFEVGSVSKSDLLSAQVQTSNSELDSLTAHQAIVNQRIALAEVLAMKESQLGDIDTVLTAEPQDYNEPDLLTEAERNRPDLLAAEANLNAAHSNLTSAKFLRLPYVTLSGSAQFNPSRTFTQTQLGVEASGRSDADRVLSGTLAVNWDLFLGGSTESRIASARAALLRAEDSRDALRRNLEAEIHQALLQYREAIERQAVANSGFASAVENLKLTQQKYNVGSTTILDLNTAQVNLTRAAADRVSAQAGIRTAEAQLIRVRGRE